LSSVRALLIGAALAAAPPAPGHHSPLMFDTASVLAFQGTVSRFDWANPHTYIFVEVIDGSGELVEWQIETDAIPLLLRSGWTTETLVPGDVVTVRANPDRNSGRKHALLVSLRTEDGTIMTSEPGRREALTGAADLSGKWQQLVPWEHYFALLAEVPLTERGTAAKAQYDLRTEDPVADCIGYPPPGAQILLYYLNEIELQDDRVVMRNEFFDSERIVYMDGREHPEQGERTNEGHSIGWWEDDVLVVDTTQFADYRSTFPGTGLPSGAEKHLIERYALSEDGTRILIEFVLEDPEFLAEPFAASMEWHYSPDAEPSRFACELEEARRFMQP